MFGDDDDMFAGNAENNPQQSVPVAQPLSRVSAPRLHSTSPSDSPWPAQQPPAAQNQAVDQSHDAGNGIPDENAAADQAHAAGNGVSGESAAAAKEQSQEAGNAVAGEGAAATNDGSQTSVNGVSGETAGGASAPTEPEVDYQSWPIKELRRFLTERGLVRNFAEPSCCHA